MSGKMPGKEVIMKKKFKVEGIDCPNCAAKIEKMIGELPGVTSSKINFMAEKLTVEADDSVAATLLDEVKKTVKVVEPDATVSEA
jgi:copper chaperone CopZ